MCTAKRDPTPPPPERESPPPLSVGSLGRRAQRLVVGHLAPAWNVRVAVAVAVVLATAVVTRAGRALRLLGDRLLQRDLDPLPHITASNLVQVSADGSAAVAVAAAGVV